MQRASAFPCPLHLLLPVALERVETQLARCGGGRVREKPTNSPSYLPCAGLRTQRTQVPQITLCCNTRLDTND